MAFYGPTAESPSAALGQGLQLGSNFYNMLITHALQQAQSRRAEAANTRAEKLQPYTIKQLMAQTAQSEGANTRNQKLLPYRIQQLQAAAEQATANAAWNNMLTGSGGGSPKENQNLNISGNLPSQGQGAFPSPSEEEQPSTSEVPNENLRPGLQPSQSLGQETIISPGNPKLARLNDFAGIKGIPQVQTHYDENGNLITRYPNGKVTMQKIGPSKAEAATNELFTKTDAKIVDQLQQNYLEGEDLQQSYQDLGAVFENPLWDKIHSGLLTKGGEKGRKLQLDVKRNYGTKEEKDLLAAAESTSEQLVAKMAKVFKGPFRIAEQSLITRVKPQAYDSPEAGKTKLALLTDALAKQQYINQRIPDLIRKEHLTASDAFRQAFGEVKGKETQEKLKQLAENQKSSEINLVEEAKALGVTPEDITYTAKLKGITEKEVIDTLKGAHHGA